MGKRLTADEEVDFLIKQYGKPECKSSLSYRVASDFRNVQSDINKPLEAETVNG